MPPVTPTTPKSERTRQRILEVALQLFTERGYAATTMRDIAAAADVSLGLTYRYFARKEDLAMALYEGMTERLRETAQGLYGGTLASRFGTITSAAVDYLERYREPFLAIAARGFDPKDDLGVLGGATEPLRASARATWEAVIEGADDAPRGAAERAQLADTLYALNLLIVMVWTQDRAPAREATREALAATEELLSWVRPALMTPFGAAGLARVAKIAGLLGIGRGE